MAIHSTSINTATDKHSKSFQELCNLYKVSSEVVSGKAFKDSGKGTSIDVCITKLIKATNQ